MSSAVPEFFFTVLAAIDSGSVPLLVVSILDKMLRISKDVRCLKKE